MKTTNLKEEINNNNNNIRSFFFTALFLVLKDALQKGIQTVQTLKQKSNKQQYNTTIDDTLREREGGRYMGNMGFKLTCE